MVLLLKMVIFYGYVCLLEGMGCWIFCGQLHFVQWLYHHHFHDSNSEIRGHTPFFTHPYDRRCLLNAIHMVTWTFNLRFSLYLWIYIYVYIYIYYTQCFILRAYIYIKKIYVYIIYIYVIVIYIYIYHIYLYSKIQNFQKDRQMIYDFF